MLLLRAGLQAMAHLCGGHSLLLNTLCRPPYDLCSDVSLLRRLLGSLSCSLLNALLRLLCRLQHGIRLNERWKVRTGVRGQQAIYLITPHIGCTAQQCRQHGMRDIASPMTCALYCTHLR